jgi:predicted ATPase
MVETQPELLAHHYTEAGLIEKAVDYWYQAGQRSIKRSANMEAIAYLSKGLNLLEVLPETPERTQHQIMLYIALGNPLIVTKGYASPEVERVYTRAWQLCQHIEETQQFVWVLFGLRRFYFHRGQVQMARDLAERSLVLAQNGSDQVILLEAHLALGATLYSPGELVNAHAHLETCLTLYKPKWDQSHTALYGIDLGVNARSHTVRVLWLLGYPDQALQRSHEALHLAKELSHPYSQAFALYFASVVHCFRREEQMVHEHTETLIALATEQVFPFFVALATMLQGWALATQGQAAEGIVKIRQGLTALRSTGEELEQLWFHALLVEACENVGQVEEGLCVLETTLALVDKTGERYYEAELHRLKGELLLQQSSDNRAEAETCFHQALSIVRSQQAKSLELRAATSLARLWQSQYKREESRELLSEIYHWFTEGHDTADLIDAKTLLDELA